MSAKELRQEARQNLQGKWQKAIVISLINVAIIFVLTLLTEKVSGIFSIAQLVITPSLTYGIAYAFYHIKKGDEIGYFDFLTIGFKNFGRSWRIAWEIIKKLWWCVLIAIIPLIIMIALLGTSILGLIGSAGISSKSYQSGYYPSSSYRSGYDYDYLEDYDEGDYLRDYLNENANNSNAVSAALAGASVGAMIGAVIALIVYIALLVFFIIRSLLYTLSYYIAVIKEGISPKEAVAESEMLMKGNRGRYFCLMLSFFGWYFLAGFVSGVIGAMGSEVVTTIASEIGTAILAPYTALAVIAFYEQLSREKATNGQNYGQMNNNAVNTIPMNNNQVNSNPVEMNNNQVNNNPVEMNNNQVNSNPTEINNNQENNNPTNEG